MSFTNSPLVTYTRISPCRNSPRNHKIDTITVHCMAGQASVEVCGELFQNYSREASSNYGIGPDGRVALYVPESDRSWASSSPPNDHRAVTVEVASDSTHPYAVTDKAYAAMLDLVTDICERNGIERLVWSTDKYTRVNHLNGANMTVHRDYANKACPGDYLYNRLGEVAEEVNRRLKGEDEMLTYEQWKEYMERYVAEKAEEPVSDWAKEAVYYCRTHGLLVGDDATRFRPRSDITRQEVAQVAMNIFKKVRGEA